MGGPISAKELARLRAGFLSYPLTSRDIPEGSIDSSKIDSTVAPASSIDEVNANIDVLSANIDTLSTDVVGIGARLTAEEAVTASLATVATSGLYADLAGIPAERLLHVEQHTWAGGEAVPYTHALAHVPVSGSLFVLDDAALTTLAYSVSGADITYTAAVPGAGVVTTFIYMREGA